MMWRFQISVTTESSNPLLPAEHAWLKQLSMAKKELVYSCTHPVAEGMEIKTATEETDRYNKACLEMLLVEHPLDCPICDKSGVCPLQDNTDLLQLMMGASKPREEMSPA